MTACAYYLRGKTFLVETDHRNLQWIENNQSPIVILWRIALQAYPFMIRHITRRINGVADWMASADMRAKLDETVLTDYDLSAITSEHTSADLIASVHGGRRLHYGVAETWRALKDAYPTARITQEEVRQLVLECPACQKMRRSGFEEITRDNTNP